METSYVKITVTPLVEKKPESYTDFQQGVKVVSFIDEKGKKFRYVLLSDKRIAEIREGKGKDVEKATMESNGDQSVFLTSLMAATVKIDGSPVIAPTISDLSMGDYLAIQSEFSDINFQ